MRQRIRAMLSRRDARRPIGQLLTIVLLLLLLGNGCTDLKRLAYEGFNRDEWQAPAQIIRSLELAPGDQIADLGSGSGYFTFRLADAVGPAGKVYAVDVDRGMNEYLAKRAREEGYKNIAVILAKYDDPLLPDSGVDLIFTCNTYHHLKDRVVYFTKVRNYLRPGGRLAVIDFSGQGWFERIFGHSTPREAIKREMKAAGYRLQKEFDFLPRQHFIIFSLNTG